MDVQCIAVQQSEMEYSARQRRRVTYSWYSTVQLVQYSTVGGVHYSTVQYSGGTVLSCPKRCHTAQWLIRALMEDMNQRRRGNYQSA